ncbi:sensor histidine kinase [Paenalkalicoccus suaedae]|uniref:Sensor histidine kinase n=1 Tax=Paenalkalicoccus suaedae TaxID=2592382 RepID=A0A859FAS7_9BACI|nr:sensor histidine kinase [Paenalkalicoccus suaedae]QKS69731.1 sensor histidine kinase [Paenalkalicoccus suaedae]
MNIFKRYKVQSIFFGSFLLFSFLVLGITTFFSYQFSSTQLIDKTTEYQEESLERLSLEIGDNLQRFQEYSVILSRQQAFRDLIAGHSSSRLPVSFRTSVNNDFANFIYSAKTVHSVEIYMNRPPVDNISLPVRYESLETLRESSWFEELDNISYSWLGSRRTNTVAGETDVVSFGRKINSPSGDLLSVLLLNLDPLIVEGWLHNAESDSEVLLIDHKGRTVSSTGESPVGDTNDHTFNNATTNKNVVNTLGLTGLASEDLVVSSPIPVLNWHLVQITPFEEITEDSRMMARNLFAIGMMTSLLIIVSIHFLTRQFTYPIQRLTTAMKTYQLHEKNPALPNDYANEFGELFSGFNELTEHVESLYKEIEKQYRRQREAEIKALQANMNPHFIYNTLDQINWTVIEQGNLEASNMIEQLGNMLRIGLSKGESIITIQEELDYLQYYMNIQHLKYGDSFTYSVDVEDSLRAMEIPKLTLQPFVENSFIHGFRNQDEGHIHLFIVKDANTIIIRICDDGIGFDKVLKPSNNQDIGGYGIKNVQERFAIYYGEHASIRLDSSTDGTTVTLRYPLTAEHLNRNATSQNQ